jgi:hypothetical protein
LLDAIRAELGRTALGNGPEVQPAVLADRAEVLGAVALALAEPAWLRRSGVVSLDGGDAWVPA